MKLIKLSDTHYIVVDDSEIKENQWYCNNKVLFLSDSKFDEGNNPNQNKNNKLVTHSTEPELLGAGWMQSVLPLLLSEVEEVINGYSVEKMADEYSYFERKSKWGNIVRNAYVQGFNTHKELVKDKLFTVEDMRRAFLSGISITGEGYNAEYSDGNNPDIETEFGESANKFIQLLLPKTEWDVEFNEQGKLKLVE